VHSVRQERVGFPAHPEFRSRQPPPSGQAPAAAHHEADRRGCELLLHDIVLLPYAASHLPNERGDLSMRGSIFTRPTLT